jgi:hypothetical protein
MVREIGNYEKNTEIYWFSTLYMVAGYLGIYYAMLTEGHKMFEFMVGLAILLILSYCYFFARK